MSVRDSKTNFSAGAFSMALFAVGVLLWGCGGSGCGGGNCPPVGCPTPKEGLGDNILGHVAYGDTPTSDTIVASVGSDGDIYFQLTGSDPSQGPNWTSWADYFKLHPFGLHDWDQAVITFYPDASQSCDTSTTNYYLQDNKLSLQVTWDESDVVWEAGEHDMVMTLDDPGTQSLIGLPGCYSVEDPDKTITVKVHLWDADLLGPDTVERGQNAEYEMKHDDLPTTYVVGYYWNSSWGSGHVDFPGNGTLTQNETWEGTLVTTNTQVTCGMRVRPPFMADSTIYRSTETLVTARNWHLDPPAAPTAIDVEANWIAPVGYALMSSIMCIDRTAAALVDNATLGGSIFTPNNVNPGHATGSIEDGLYSGVTYEEITSGPNQGLWYIGSANYAINQEVVFSKWIRQSGVAPSGSSTTWYEENLASACFESPYTSATLTQFYAAAIAHESLGNKDTNNDGITDNGHYRQLLIAENANDLHLALEALIHSAKLQLGEKVGIVYLNITDKIKQAALSHVYVRGTWEHVNGVANYQMRSWHTSDPYNNVSGSWAPTNGPCDCYWETEW